MQLEQHPWFQDFEWDKLSSKQMIPPFKPNVKKVFQYLKHLTEEDNFNEEENKIDLKKKEIQKLFREYDTFQINKENIKTKKDQNREKVYCKATKNYS